MKRWKRLAILGAFLVLLLVASVVGPWQYYEYLTNAELDRIRAAGEPVTIDELGEYYRVAADDFPHQADWLAAFAELQKVNSSQRPKRPFAELRGRYSYIGEPWPKLELAETLLRPYATALSLAHQAGAHPGPVHGSFKGRWDYWQENPLADDVTRLSNLLQLTTSVHVHRGNAEAAAKDLLLLLAVGRCLELYPSRGGSINRRLSDYYAFEHVVQTLSAIWLSDAALEELQKAVRAIRYEDHYRIVLLGKRVSVLHAMSDDDLYCGWSYFQFHQWGEHGIVRTPRSRFAYLSTMRDYIAASQWDWPSMRPATEAINRRRRDPSQLPFFEPTIQRLEDFEGGPPQLFSNLHRIVAQCRAVDAILAIERFRRKNHRLPLSLEELAPQFLPEVPLDPINGQPMRYRVDQDAIYVYSIEANELDDGSLPDFPPTYLDDWGFRLPLKERP